MVQSKINGTIKIKIYLTDNQFIRNYHMKDIFRSPVNGLLCIVTVIK